MIHKAQQLALLGLLQRKSLTVAEPVQIFPLTGSLVYTGIAPIVNIEPPVDTVVLPSTGSLVYTGIAPTVNIQPPFLAYFRTYQEYFPTITDTPWRVTYIVYDSSYVVQDTITHNVNRGATVPISQGRATRYYSTFTPFYVEVLVERLTETIGAPPRNNRTNFSGNVTWTGSVGMLPTFPDDILYQYTFADNARVTQSRTITSPMSSGTGFGVTITEGYL